MRKILLTLCLMAIATASWGARALSIPRTVTQPDGTQLTVIAHGDEDLSWYTTTDGILLVVENEFFMVADVDESGELVSTNILAHEKGLRKDAEKNAIALQNKQRFLEKAPELKRRNMARRIGIGTQDPPFFPHSGSPKAVVILVEFKDSTFSVPNPRKTFNDYLNGEAPFADEGFREDRNYGSVFQYFRDMSNGTFTPQFDIYGPVRLENDLKYYGERSGTTADIRFADMMKEACTMMNDSLDFSQYDADGDGIVDLVYFIYAGYSESIGAPSDCIWPKSGVNSGIGTYDGKKVRRFGLNNELNYYPDYAFKAAPYKRINGIGLFCHEFSHTLGLPDLYATKSSAQINNQCMEYWDLMDAGEYTDNGYRPTPYTPWEKEVMGWMTLEELTEPAIVTLEDQDAYKITNNENDEYLILQNIQLNGWAGEMLGHGMLVYKVDYKKSSVTASDYPNNTAGKPGLTVWPADGILINLDQVTKGNYTRTAHTQSHAGDPFPGSQNVTELLSVEMNETTIEKPIYDITEENGVITFKFLDKNLGTGINGLTLKEKKDTDNSIYTLDGQLVGRTLLHLPKGIYIQGGKKLVVK